MLMDSHFFHDDRVYFHAENVVHVFLSLMGNMFSEMGENKVFICFSLVSINFLSDFHMISKWTESSKKWTIHQTGDRHCYGLESNFDDCSPCSFQTRRCSSKTNSPKLIQIRYVISKFAGIQRNLPYLSSKTTYFYSYGPLTVVS